MYTPKVGSDFATLAKKSRTALLQEANGQGPQLQEIQNSAVAGCPCDIDNTAWKNTRPAALRKARQELTLLGQHQATLNHYNVFEHLTSMHRVLGGDGQMAALVPTSLSRVVCECAVRINWLLDTNITPEGRLVRSAASLYNSALYELKAANKKKASDPSKAATVAEAQNSLDQLDDLLDKAQVVRGLGGRGGNDVVRIEMPSAGVKAPLDLKMGPEMEARLPEVPEWYTRGSGVAHGATWRLRQVVKATNDPRNIQFEPDLVEIAEASIAAIYASALDIKSYALYFGLGPDTYIAKSKSRANMIEIWKQNWIGLRAQGAT